MGEVGFCVGFPSPNALPEQAVFCGPGETLSFCLSGQLPPPPRPRRRCLLSSGGKQTLAPPLHPFLPPKQSCLWCGGAWGSSVVGEAVLPAGSQGGLSCPDLSLNAYSPAGVGVQGSRTPRLWEKGSL